MTMSKERKKEREIESEKEICWTSHIHGHGSTDDIEKV